MVTLMCATENTFGPVVQLVRMLPCHGRGRGFESRPDRLFRSGVSAPFSPLNGENGAFSLPPSCRLISLQ